MKKFLNLIAISILTTTSITSINTIIKSSINHKLNSVSDKTDKIWNQLISKWTKDVKNGGSNYYDWYFFYHVIGLSHKTLNDVNNGLGAGIGAVSAILAAAIPPLVPILAVVTPVLIAQWYCWEIPDYDKGNGVVIKFIGGTVPQIIVGVNSQ